MSNFMNVDANRMQNNRQNNGQTSSATQTPHKNDTDAFNDALNEPDKQNTEKSQSDSTKKEGQGAEQNTNPFAQMTNPLDSIFSNARMVKGAAQSAPVLNEKLVETILVSQPDADNQEVRLTLNRDILPDTEIRMMRDVNGTLNIILQSNNASSFQTLVAGQNTLKAMLEQGEGEIKITVESGDTGQNDTNQRSRGHTEYTEEEQ